MNSSGPLVPTLALATLALATLAPLPLALLPLVLATPALAQSAPPRAAALLAAPGAAPPVAADATPSAPSGATNALPAAAAGSPVLTHGTDVRASKVIGSAVFNDADEKVGAVDDVVLGAGDRPVLAILSIGGFLGMGSKLVAVPFGALRFGDTRENGDNRVRMSGADKDALASMGSYSYDAGR